VWKTPFQLKRYARFRIFFLRGVTREELSTTLKRTFEVSINMEHKTLIVYASKGGATKQTSEIIAEVLKDKHKFEVDLVDLRKSSAKLQDYDNVVVGAGVRGGKVYGEALDFLKQDFGNRRVAFFVCCGGAGDPKSYDESCMKYLTEVLANYHNVKPVATEAFGGRMKMLGKTLFDNVDPAKIRAWAETLGKEFVA
jgi:menaquinone-dependent protoporphyrinogen IX oxidase